MSPTKLGNQSPNYVRIIGDDVSRVVTGFRTASGEKDEFIDGPTAFQINVQPLLRNGVINDNIISYVPTAIADSAFDTSMNFKIETEPYNQGYISNYLNQLQQRYINFPGATPTVAELGFLTVNEDLLSKINSAVIGPSVTTIGNDIFGFSRPQTSVATASKNAFCSLVGLTNITIGVGVTSIGTNFFNGTNRSAMTFTFAGGTTNITVSGTGNVGNTGDVVQYPPNADSAFLNTLKTIWPTMSFTTAGSATGSGTSVSTGTEASTGTETGFDTNASPGTGTDSGTGTGTGTSASSGTGTGTSTGTSTGTGTSTSSGTGSGTGTSVSSGTGTGTSASSGTGTGTGTSASSGTGTGTSASSGTGSGEGTGTGFGTGTGEGTGTGTGEGTGTGTGEGTGTGTVAGTGFYATPNYENYVRCFNVPRNTGNASGFRPTLPQDLLSEGSIEFQINIPSTLRPGTSNGTPGNPMRITSIGRSYQTDSYVANTPGGFTKLDFNNSGNNLSGPDQANVWIAKINSFSIGNSVINVGDDIFGWSVSTWKDPDAERLITGLVGLKNIIIGSGVRTIGDHFFNGTNRSAMTFIFTGTENISVSGTGNVGRAGDVVQYPPNATPALLATLRTIWPSSLSATFSPTFTRYSLVPGANLTNADLSGFNLTGIDLSGAILTGVKSGGIQGKPTKLPNPWELRKGYLMGPTANLTIADLSGANLLNVNLSGAILTGVKSGGILGKPTTLPLNWKLKNGYLIGPGADLTNADLSGVDLTGLDLSGAILTGVKSGGIKGNVTNLPSQWKLKKGYLIGPGANLTSAKLSNVDLSGVYLRSANLLGANLSNANLSGVDLSGVNLKNANLYGAKISSNTIFLNNQFDGVTSGQILDASNIIINNRTLNTTDYKIINGYIIGPGVNLSKMILNDNSFNVVDLSGANLSNIVLTKANLTGANLTRANLTVAKLNTANLTRANLTSADLSGVILTHADLSGVNLTNANLTRANLTDANLTNANLTNAITTNIKVSNNTKVNNATINNSSASLFSNCIGFNSINKIP